MGSWLRRNGSTGAHLSRIVCFPHAGGTAQAFAGWAKGLSASVDVVAVQYPGRQDRLSEGCLTRMADMADQLAAELRPLRDLPMALIGHSMGAAVAYEVALRLETNVDFVMERVFVSARGAPHRYPSEGNHRLSDSDLVKAIQALGGRDASVYEFPSLWPVILPPLRADLELLDDYRPASLSALHCPITAFAGASDHTCPTAALNAWGEATAGAFELEVFPGGHHYFWQHEEAVMAAVARRLR